MVKIIRIAEKEITLIIGFTNSISAKPERWHLCDDQYDIEVKRRLYKKNINLSKASLWASYGRNDGAIKKKIGRIIKNDARTKKNKFIIKIKF